MQFRILAVLGAVIVVAAAGTKPAIASQGGTRASSAACPVVGTSPKDRQALETLRRSAFPPTDLALFTPEVYADAPSLQPAAVYRFTEEGLRAKLSQLLAERFQGQNRPIEAALAVYDDARLRTSVPDPRLRMALSLLKGTVGEAAIDAVRHGVFRTAAFGATPSEAYASSALASGSSKPALLVNERYQHEDPLLLAVILAQAALHQDDQAAPDEALVADAIGTLVYAQILESAPALARSGTELARRLNTELMARLNSRDAEGKLRLLTATSSTYPAGSDRASFGAPFEPLGASTAGNATLEAMLRAVTQANVTNPRFDMAAIALLDTCQRLLRPSQLLVLARDLKLDLAPQATDMEEAWRGGAMSADDEASPADAAADEKTAGSGSMTPAAERLAAEASTGSKAVAALTPDQLRVLPAGTLTDMTRNYLNQQGKAIWDKVRDPRIAAIDTTAEVQSHANFVRSKVVEGIGGLPAPAPSLNVRITGTLDREGYQVDKLIYESQANFHVTANLYRPKTSVAPYPAVLGIPGHSDDGNAKAYSEYQKVWIALAQRGFLVLTFDPFGQGERFEQYNAAANRPLAGKSGTGEHTIAGTKMYLTGTNPLRWMAFDAMRAIDYLFTRKDVDKTRIAVIGNSGGGHQTSWLATLDNRIAAAGPSSSLTSHEAIWLGNRGPGDPEENLFNYVGQGLSQADLYAAFAPKPMKIFAAIKDYQPIAGTREAYNEIRTRFYTPYGKASNVELFEFNDQHGWTKPRREKTVEWLEKVFNKRIVTYVEPDPFLTEPPANLWATPEGQVHDTGGPGGATTHAMNHAIATSLYNKRAALTTSDLQALVRTRLDLGTWSGPPAVTAKETLTATDYRVEKITLATETGITVPGLVFVPTNVTGRRSGVLYLNNLGKAADAGDTGPIAKIARSGRIVLAIDARQWGESAYPSCSGYSCKNNQVAVRALMLGKNLVGMQTRDAMRALDYLASRPDVDPANLAVIGKGKAGVHALFTAFLDARVKKVHLAGTPASYLSITNTQRPGELMDIVINKVLADFDLTDLQTVLGTRVNRTTTTNPDYVIWLKSSPFPLP